MSKSSKVYWLFKPEIGKMNFLVSLSLAGGWSLGESQKIKVAQNVLKYILVLEFWKSEKNCSCPQITKQSNKCRHHSEKISHSVYFFKGISLCNSRIT